MNPSNGLCLSVLHHAAFDNGFITITPDCRVRVSSNVKESKNDNAGQAFFSCYDDQLFECEGDFFQIQSCWRGITNTGSSTDFLRKFAVGGPSKESEVIPNTFIK